jgi:hypothetical protein
VHEGGVFLEGCSKHTLSESNLRGGGGDGEEAYDGYQPQRAVPVVNVQLVTEAPISWVLDDELCA